jgi:hypothetical protein
MNTHVNLHSNQPEEIIHNGTRYQKLNMMRINYRINVTSTTGGNYSLLDHGSNGGLFGSDVHILHHTIQRVTITGIDNLEVGEYPFALEQDMVSLIVVQPYPLSINMHILVRVRPYNCQANLNHSNLQLTKDHAELEEINILQPQNGYFIPLNIIQGLPHFFCPPTDQEIDDLPHILMTSDLDWDPSSLDNKIDTNYNSWYPQDKYIDQYAPHKFNKYGSKNIDNSILSYLVIRIQVSSTNVTTHPPNIELLRQKFGWCSNDVIKHTLDRTTQYAESLHLYGDMRKHFKAQYPAFNVSRHSESVATDNVYSNTPVVDNGSKCTQIFIGHDSLVIDVYGMKTDKRIDQ